MKRIILITLITIMCTMTYAQKKLVALSFDDGPNTETTVKMLDVLKKHGVKASFFVIGKNIDEESAKVMQRAHNEGHDIENHSQTHSAMPSLTADSIKAEIAYTSALIEKYVGEHPQFFRPPYIAVDRKMYEAIDLPFICGEGCEDWLPEVTADQRYERMLASARDGLIYLLHDFVGNDNTVKAVNRIIPELKKRGYEFVTVCELFKRKGIKPYRNTIYTDILNSLPATKSAIVYYSNSGTTAKVANMLCQKTGAFPVRLECVKPYSTDFMKNIGEYQEDMKNGTLRELKPLGVDLAKYDTLYIGFPVWAGNYANPIATLLKDNDLKGKTIIPFCSFGSGGNTAVKQLKKALPESNVLSWYGVRADRISKAEPEIESFLVNLGVIPGEKVVLPEFSAQRPMTDDEKTIFQAACGSYPMPLGVPVSVASRKLAHATEYVYVSKAKGMDGNESEQKIYVTKDDAEGSVPEFTQVER